MKNREESEEREASSKGRVLSSKGLNLAKARRGESEGGDIAATSMIGTSWYAREIFTPLLRRSGEEKGV